MTKEQVELRRERALSNGLDRWILRHDPKSLRMYYDLRAILLGY